MIFGIKDLHPIRKQTYFNFQIQKCFYSKFNVTEMCSLIVTVKNIMSTSLISENLEIRVNWYCKAFHQAHKFPSNNYEKNH